MRTNTDLRADRLPTNDISVTYRPAHLTGVVLPYLAYPAMPCGVCGCPAPLTTAVSARSLTMDFETKIYSRIGGYGRYNRIISIFSWFPNFAVMLNLFCDVFYTLIPGSYHCKPDPTLLPSGFLFSNYSRQGYLNFTIPWVNGSGLSHCELYKYPRNVSNFIDSIPKEIVPCTSGWEYDQAAALQSNYVTEVNGFIYILGFDGLWLFLESLCFCQISNHSCARDVFVTTHLPYLIWFTRSRFSG